MHGLLFLTVISFKNNGQNFAKTIKTHTSFHLIFSCNLKFDNSICLIFRLNCLRHERRLENLIKIMLSRPVEAYRVFHVEGGLLRPDCGQSIFSTAKLSQVLKRRTRRTPTCHSDTIASFKATYTDVSVFFTAKTNAYVTFKATCHSKTNAYVTYPDMSQQN